MIKSMQMWAINARNVALVTRFTLLYSAMHYSSYTYFIYKELIPKYYQSACINAMYQSASI